MPFGTTDGRRVNLNQLYPKEGPVADNRQQQGQQGRGGRRNQRWQEPPRPQVYLKLLSQTKTDGIWLCPIAAEVKRGNWPVPDEEVRLYRDAEDLGSAVTDSCGVANF